MAVVVDINGILDDVVSLFNSVNTTTGSPVDLSGSMSRRVQLVGSVHPMKIAVQSSKYPFVTIFCTGKNIVGSDIASTQLMAKRQADVMFDVVGICWNNNFSSIGQDPADRDCNYLMENVELALRSLPSVNSKIKWQQPSAVQYYDSLQEGNHLRAGVIKLKGKVYY